MALDLRIVIGRLLLATRPKPGEELRGLCCALTARPRSDTRGLRPEMVAVGILIAVGALNVIFW